MRVIIGICGASGVQYGLRLLQELKKQKIETHLILSEWAEKLIEIETEFKVNEVKKMAGFVYSNQDMTACIASSSYKTEGMIVLPASLKTVSEIASAGCNTLIARCADIMLRTRNKLVVGLRETPLSAMALENLHKISMAGGIIFPLCPAFYHKPKTLEDQSNFIVGKTMDLMGIENKLFKRWNGVESK